MRKEYYIYKGEHFIRVNKVIAQRVYNSGNIVYLIQNMMRLGNPWQGPCPLYKKDNDDRNFDTKVNEFIYYNCNKECGKKVKYFVKRSTLK